MLLKNRQQTQKKSLHTIELWQASGFFISFKKCGISNSTESNVIFCELGPLSSFLIKVNTKILKTNNHIEPLKPALSLELIIIIKKFSLSL